MENGTIYRFETDRHDALDEDFAPFHGVVSFETACVRAEFELNINTD